nr:PQQ-dependent catabolism-associated CXXCW motif protein [Mangrovicoccus sp. HB161399]
MLSAAAAAAQVPEPDGYRMDEYRAPVPDTLQGATVVGAEEAHALWESGSAAFVDVLPRAPKPANLPEGTIWRDKPRPSIPGAMWLPNTGYGALAPQTEAYLEDGLAKAAGGDAGHPLVIFCQMDCWMSWNAAKRAVGFGYTAVFWFPDGTDGWDLEGYPLEEAQPEPGQ